MMVKILLYLSNGLILFAYFTYFILLIFNRKKKITENTSFDISKDIISKYNSINIIESKGYFSIYNIKRKVIKLATNCYYGNNLSSVAISLVESGISVLDDNKNKIINFFRKIFSNLKILYIFPILTIAINNISYNVSDAKTSIFIVGLIAIIMYFLIDIKENAINWIKENIININDIVDKNKNKVINFLNKLLFIDKLIFFGELVMLIRFVAILLEFN